LTDREIERENGRYKERKGRREIKRVFKIDQ